MATIDFPGSPILNQQYTFNLRTWFWDGVGWERYYPTAAITSAATLLAGPFVLLLYAPFPSQAEPATLLVHT